MVSAFRGDGIISTKFEASEAYAAIVTQAAQAFCEAP
jgi:hypothetical protein